MHSKILSSILLAGTMSCGTAKVEAPSLYIEGFHPPPLKEGFTRYVTPVVEKIEPGADLTLCQFISEPAEKDQDVVAFSGEQSKYGHHVVLYATSADKPVGTTKDCGVDDQFAQSFIGAVGGEGLSESGAYLPKGIVFRLPKGKRLMANVHFINTGSATVKGQSVIDIQLQDPSAERQPASLFTNVATNFVLENGVVSHETSCVVKQELQLITFGNHMHWLGTSAHSELVRANGDVVVLKHDTVWKPEMQFDNKSTVWQPGEFIKVFPGDTIKTKCQWENNKGRQVTFPEEMCVGAAFVLPGGPQIDCVDGNWDG